MPFCLWDSYAATQKEDQKLNFKTDLYRLMQVKSIKGSILQYFQPFVFKTFVLSILEWPLKTGFSVCHMLRNLQFLKVFLNNKSTDKHLNNMQNYPACKA